LFSFLKSQSFWLSVAHVAIVAGGAFLSYKSGTPLPLVVSGGLNALAPSPVTPAAPSDAKNPS
jgi:hypothetical protein